MAKRFNIRQTSSGTDIVESSVGLYMEYAEHKRVEDKCNRLVNEVAKIFAEKDKENERLTADYKALEDKYETLLKRWFGCTERCLQESIEDNQRLTAELAECRADAEQIAKWMTSHSEHVTNHACRECLPNGEILIDGFVCAWHKAIARSK